MTLDDKAITVRQSNSLIEASYRIASTGEGRLIRALIAQIQPNDEDFKLYRVSVSDFARLFNITGESAYEQIKKAADDLTSRKIKVERGKSWLFMNWLSSAEYIHGSGYVELCFDKKLKPYLLQLKGYFTQYELESIVSFKSVHSMRIYELLKMEQFKAEKNGQFKRDFDYSDLRNLIGLEETEYALFADFRRFVVEIAVREINSASNLFISQVDYPKTGRKVSHIVFHCEPARQIRLDVDGPEPVIEAVEKGKEHPDDVRELLAMGISESSAYKWRKKYGVKRLTRSLAYTRAMQKAGKIHSSLTGFLARAIADDLGNFWEEEEKARTDRAREEHKKAKAKQDEETVRKASEKEQREKRLQEFLSLPEEEKNKIRTLYVSNASAVVRSVWEKACFVNPDAPETDKRVLVSFLAFFSKLMEPTGNGEQ